MNDDNFNNLNNIHSLIKSLPADINYVKPNGQLEQEVGNFLVPAKEKYQRLNRIDLYNNLSNDIRHQYASALMAQKYGNDIAKFLGNANEFFDFNASGRADTLRDQRANEIGRQYGLKYPNYTKEQILQKLYDDYYKY